MLASLAQDAEPVPDPPSSFGAQAVNSASLGVDAAIDPSLESEQGQLNAGGSQRPEDERVELLRLLDQAAAELAPRSNQPALSSRQRTRTTSPPQNGVIDLAHQLETSSLADETTSSASGISNPGGALAGGAHPHPSSTHRFWPPSETSSTTTVDEAGATAGDSDHGKVLVWDQTPVDDDFGFYEVQDDPLAFLASVFPHIELAQLEAKIQEANAAKQAAAATADPDTVEAGRGSGGTPLAEPSDLEALIEDLLSQDLITSLTEADAEAAAAENARAPDPDRIADLSKQQKRRVKAAHKASNSYSLTSTPHVSYASAAKAADDGRTATALAAAPNGANAWVSFSSQASLLATVLHIPPNRITSTYYQQSSSLPLTISVLLTQLAAERVFETIPNALELRAQLRLIVPPSRASDDDLEVLLSATEGDLSDALDLHHFIRDVETSMGTSLTLSSLVAGHDADSAAANGTTAGADGFTLVPSAAARRATASHTNHLPSAPSDRYSYADCSALALEYLVKRNEAFRTAARSFQRGGAGERGAAGYWAEKGREYDRERRKWEERAARATVGERKYVARQLAEVDGLAPRRPSKLTMSPCRRHITQDPYTVDLHGLTLAHALTIVTESCNTWWAANRDCEDRLVDVREGSQDRRLILRTLQWNMSRRCGSSPELAGTRATTLQSWRPP